MADLPFRMPIVPALAQSAPQLPEGPGWAYEAKWDGFRALVAIRGGGVDIYSRQGKRLTPAFADLAVELGRAFSPGTVLDGELVVVRDDRLDFDALLGRLPAGRAGGLAATLAVFDLLAEGGESLLAGALSQRRARLEAVVEESPWLVLCPQTEDVEAARRMFVELAPRGFEGVVSKRLEEPYRPGGRAWVKTRWKRSVEVVAAGFSGRRLLLGMYDAAGLLHFVGATLPLGREHSAVLEAVRQLPRRPAFVEGVTPAMGRFEGQRHQTWTDVEPLLVVEVAYDQVTDRRFRHPARLLRPRIDKAAAECLREDIEVPAFEMSDLAGAE